VCVERLKQILGRKLERFDNGTRRFQLAHLTVDKRCDFSVDPACGRNCPVADPAAPDDAGQIFERGEIALALVPVAPVPPTHGFQHGGRIARIAAHRADMRNGSKWACRISGHACEGWLDTCDAAEGGGDPDRSAAIAAEVKDARAEGCGNRGPARRPSGGHVRIVRVAGDPERVAVRHRLPAEFRRRGLPEKDNSGVPHQLHTGCIFCERNIAGDKTAETGGPAFHPDDVLDGGRNAVDS